MPRKYKKKKLRQVAIKSMLGVSVSATTVSNTTFPIALTPNEQEELDALQKERVRETKEIQCKKFKMLSPHLREHIINWIQVEKLVNDIANTTVEKSIREAELTSKQFPIEYFTIDNTWLSVGVIPLNKLRNIFSDEEIIAMHNDVEAERALLESE